MIPYSLSDINLLQTLIDVKNSLYIFNTLFNSKHRMFNQIIHALLRISRESEVAPVVCTAKPDL